MVVFSATLLCFHFPCYNFDVIVDIQLLLLQVVMYYSEFIKSYSLNCFPLFYSERFYYDLLYIS